jgi:hypothetical protein
MVGSSQHSFCTAIAGPVTTQLAIKTSAAMTAITALIFIKTYYPGIGKYLLVSSKKFVVNRDIYRKERQILEILIMFGGFRQQFYYLTERKDNIRLHPLFING